MTRLKGPTRRSLYCSLICAPANWPQNPFAHKTDILPRRVLAESGLAVPSSPLLLLRHSLYQIVPSSSTLRWLLSTYPLQQSLCATTP